MLATVGLKGLSPRTRRTSCTALTAIPAFVADLGHFAHALSGLDPVWRVLFPDAAGRWQHVDVTRDEDTHYLAHVTRPTGSDGLAVGPEGGWSDDELSLSRAAGWHAVSLGTRILRIETACLALAAILSQEM